MSVFVERRRKAEDPRVGTPRKNARLLHTTIGQHGLPRLLIAMISINHAYARVSKSGNTATNLQPQRRSPTGYCILGDLISRRRGQRPHHEAWTLRKS